MITEDKLLNMLLEENEKLEEDIRTLQGSIRKGQALLAKAKEQQEKLGRLIDAAVREP